jgi:hypothetical protein
MSCLAGGNRFDAGAYDFSPQLRCSRFETSPEDIFYNGIGWLPKAELEDELPLIAGAETSNKLSYRMSDETE